MDPQSNFSELAGEANTLQQAGGDVGAAPAALGYAGWTTPAVADEAHGLTVGGRGVANGTGERARGRGRLVPEPGARGAGTLTRTPTLDTLCIVTLL
jgi:hypothetical protein